MLHRPHPAELLARLVLRTTAWIVPADERPDWHAEWAAELWHVVRSTDSESNTTPLSFIRGAIPDALCLRREAWATGEAGTLPVPRMQNGPYRCLGVLASACAIAFALVLALPGPRRALLPHHYTAANDLVLITRGGSNHLDIPSISAGEYRTWRGSTRRLYSDLAFYRPQQLRLVPHASADTSIVFASGNLFAMLGVSPQMIAPAEPGQPRLIVSSRLWRELHFAPSLELAGQRVAITGVLDENEWQLPGHADAWLLADNSSVAGVSPVTRGYVLARVRPGAFPSSHRVMIDGDLRYPCLSLAELAERPASGFLCALLLAALALPATLPIPLGATARRTRRIKPRLRAWSYLTAKLVLCIPLVYAASLLSTYGRFAPESTAAPYFQIGTGFFGLLFLFRWSWQDQRSRCPECLGRLTHPARVGLASRSFLAWSGTELVCTSGHGLLHIPELPTSWFSAPRWLALDASWKPLFASSIP